MSAMVRNIFFTNRLALLPFSLLIGLAVSTTCFYPNGDSDAGHSPCDPTAEVSVCCAAGFQCLSNGLCADYRYPDWQRILRGGCTDKNWGKECGTVCKDVWPQGDEAVTYCGDGKYCCDGDDCCTKDTTLLSLGEPTIIATAKTQSSTSQTSTLSSTTALQSTTSPDPGAVYKGSKNTIAIGVGVGVAVGVLLFAALFAVCIFIQRKKRRQRQNNEVRGVMERDVGSEMVNPFDAAGYNEQSNRSPNQTGALGARNVRKSWAHIRGGSANKSNASKNSELGDGDVIELSAEKVHELPADRDPGEMDGKERRLTKIEDAARTWPL